MDLSGDLYHPHHFALLLYHRVNLDAVDELLNNCSSIICVIESGKIKSHVG
jgi:hypothetical protein